MAAITKQTTSTYVLKSSFKKPVRTLVCGFAPSPDLEDIVEKDETLVPSEPVANGKLETFPEDLVYCKRMIKRARLPLVQRVLNKDIRKGNEVTASGATHMKMTLISLEDAQKSREVVYHSVEHLTDGAAFGRGFRTDLISLRDARQRDEIKYRSVSFFKF